MATREVIEVEEDYILSVDEILVEARICLFVFFFGPPFYRELQSLIFLLVSNCNYLDCITELYSKNIQVKWILHSLLGHAICSNVSCH